MEARTTVPPSQIPFGLIFASFMVSKRDNQSSECGRWCDARTAKSLWLLLFSRVSSFSGLNDAWQLLLQLPRPEKVES